MTTYYEMFCFSLLGVWVRKRRDSYVQIRKDLTAARFKIFFEVYISIAIITSLIEASLLGIVGAFIPWTSLCPPLFLNLINSERVIVSLGFAIVTFLVSFWGIYFVFLLYPRLHLDMRIKEIDATLPAAVKYMAALSRVGTPPHQIFKMLGDRSQIYGASAHEMHFIAREITLFGRDVREAIRVVSNQTASPRMRDFLQGTIASISSRLDLHNYFQIKAKQYFRENQRVQKKYIQRLEIIVESYVTVVGAGSMFFIILYSTLINAKPDIYPISPFSFITYIAIPLANLIFLILIKTVISEGDR